jgi:hypothetical protein
MPSLGCTDDCRPTPGCRIFAERPVKIGHRFKRVLWAAAETRSAIRVAFDDNFAAFVNQAVKNSTQIAGELSGFESSSSYLF